MERLNTRERIRRAGEVLDLQGGSVDITLLLQAWESLKGLRCEELPAEIRPGFSFLEHEISRAAHEELSVREVTFLMERIRKLESTWSEIAGKTLDDTA